MSFGSEQIIAALAQTGVPARRLEAEQRIALFQLLKEKLAVDFSGGFPWDRPEAPRGVHREDGWKSIAEYAGDNACAMFSEDRREVWEFESAADLFRVLEQCAPMEFYVCDRAVSYLLCHNHHDVLIGWGAAQEWVRRQVKK